MKNNKMMKNIMNIFLCSNLYRDKQFEGTGLSGNQSKYVIEVCKHPGITQDKLAQKLHVNKSNVTRQLVLLEENEYITRKRSEQDKRTIMVFPTPKMMKALPLVQASFEKWYTLITENNLSEEEQVILNSLLEKLSKRSEEVIK